MILFHAVLDTNVIVSALLSSNELDSAPAQVVKDPDDAIFYETMLAKASTATCFLVTGNLRHFPKNPLVLTPRLMVALLEKTEIFKHK